MNFRELSGLKQWSIRQCQDIGFGKVSFYLRRGEPDMTKPYRTKRTLKLASGENGPRPEAGSADFVLCQEHRAMLAQLARLDDGVEVTVEIKHGLPFLIEIQQDHKAA